MNRRQKGTQLKRKDNKLKKKGSTYKLEQQNANITNMNTKGKQCKNNINATMKMMAPTHIAQQNFRY